VIVEVASKRRRTAFPATTVVVDVTSRGPEPWVRLSPFYPHGGIPMPLSPGDVGASVEGIWQGLKVFADADVDASKLTVTKMTGLKRTVRKFGPVLGHRHPVVARRPRGPIPDGSLGFLSPGCGSAIRLKRLCGKDFRAVWGSRCGAVDQRVARRRTLSDAWC
jgi:hypothetical protein